jgi:predicted TIM-barrel fold metal-dependent hydrolase
MARTVGLDRCVIVQPSFFAFDNACTLDSVGRSGNRARAIVVVKPDVAKADLEAMHHRGARGARAQTVVAGGMSFDAIEEISKRIAPFGWHLQLYLDARSLPDLVQRLRRLPVDVVFDHMAHIQPDSGMEEPGFVALLNLLADGKAWVKLSNALVPPSAERARRLVSENPERILWGSDWPHVAYLGAPPDEGALINDLADWVPDVQMRHRILVSNPDRLYFQGN